MVASNIVGYGAGSGGWWPLIREPFAGAWQRNLEVRADHVVMNVTVFRCISLICSDIAKMRMKLMTQTSDANIWEEASNPAWSPVLSKPNHFQNRIQFFENWLNSKLNAGNTYILKERDNRNVVVGLYILDPRRVRPLVADSGDVFYELHTDNLAGILENVNVPASEIIHDRWNCFFHPLCGLGPIVANGLVATQGLRIQEHSAQFFRNGANPGGILTAPGKIDNDTAERLKADWQQRFTGSNVGFVAVLGDGLTYNPMSVTPIDAQLIDQLKWTAETIAASYGVPAYKAGVGALPTNTNIDALETQYYQSCLQIHIEAIELCLDEGLNLPNDWTVEFDLDGLLRMDAATMMKYLSDGVSSAIIEPNEARGRIGLAPKTGGDALYLQQQNYSLAALAKRDQSADPFSKGSPPNPAPNSTSDPNPAPSSVPNPDQTTNNSLVGDLSRRLLRFANNN
jgi:HK97 family phage portal protein